MEFGVEIGTIKKGIKIAILMHILIFDSSFQEKVKNYFLFSVIFAQFFTFYPQNPKRPDSQSANMAQNVSNSMYFKKNQVCKIPRRGGGNKRVSS